MRAYYQRPKHLSKCVFTDINIGSTTLHCFKIVPPASSYIIIPPGGIIMYRLAGGTILK